MSAPSRKPFPEHLPRERVVVAAPESCTCCGSKQLCHPSIYSKIAVRASAWVGNLRRSRSSHSRVAKKLSAMALS